MNDEAQAEIDRLTRENASLRTLEGALQQSEERYRLLFTGMTEGFALHEIICDENHVPCDYRFLELNPAFETLTGLRAAVIRGKRVKEVLPSTESYWIESYGKVALNGESVQFENYSDALGKYFHVLAFSPMHGQFATIISDVTERKRAEQRISQTARELAQLHTVERLVSASLSIDHVAESALKGILSAVQANAAFLFLRDGEELRLQCIVPDDASTSFMNMPVHQVGQCMCGLAVRDRKSLFSKNIFTDLRCTWEECKKAGMMSFAALPLFNGNEVIGVIGLSSITEYDYGEHTEFLETLAGTVAGGIKNATLYSKSKATEEALRESQALYHSFVEHMPAGVFRKDREGRYIFVNSVFCGLKGLQADEIIGRTPRELSEYESLVEADRPSKTTFRQRTLVSEGEDHHAHIMRTGKSIEIEEVYARPDGSMQYLHVVKSPVFSSDGTVIGSQGIQFDISELKSLEHQLVQAQKLEGLGTLAGGIAHEFNNLLAMILGSAELLQSQAAHDPQLKKYADRIVEASQRGASISRQLLIFSRPNQSELKAISLSHAINEVKDLLIHFLPKSITVHTAINVDNGIILGDAGQIHQALLNLAINAGDAMADGGMLSITEYSVDAETIHRKFGYASEVPYVAISVQDTGRGMDARTLQKIFDPFFTTKEKGKGTGLGLSIVHGIVKSHNGFIDVDSERGQGTTFTMYFPTVASPVDQEPNLPPPHALPVNATVLLVDDEAIIREMLTEFLVHSGFHVLTAANGQDALTLFRDHHDTISIVITDLGMPQMGGEELFVQLRKIDASVKVIASSGYLDGTTTDRLLGIGFSGVLTKPYKLQKIFTLMHALLSEDKHTGPHR